MRFVFIVVGVSAIQRFHWIIYIFGGILIWSGIKLAFGEEVEVEPEKNFVLKLFRRFVPTTAEYSGKKFFVREAGRRMATPLLAVLIVVETTDLLLPWTPFLRCLPSHVTPSLSSHRMSSPFSACGLSTSLCPGCSGCSITCTMACQPS